MSNLLEGKVFVKISELDATTTFDTNDEFVLVRNGTTVKTAGIDFVDTVVSIGNLATKTYTDAAVAALVAGAPDALDTLNELSAALNNNADFASVVTNQLSLKLDVGDFGLYFWNELNAITTYHVAEGANLYYTEQRVDANFATKNTDALAEGSTNLYYTNTRALEAVVPFIPTSIFDLDVPNVAIPENIPGYLYYDGTDLSWQATVGFSGDYNDLTNAPSLTTDTITEGTNLYHTTARVRSAIGAGTNIEYSSSTGIVDVTATPTFTTVTTTNLNVQNVTFTGTGAVTIASGNDLNLSAVGNVSINGNAIGNLAYADNLAFADLINVNGVNGPTKIAIGAEAGMNNQGVDSVAIGYIAGGVNQGGNAVAIGSNAANGNQGDNAVAIGCLAGNVGQGVNAVAIGEGAGFDRQGNSTVAIGSTAGGELQGQHAIAIGTQAGRRRQGTNSIAIGFRAGYMEDEDGPGQGNNSIIINATGAAIGGINWSTPNTFTVAPIRDAVATTKGLFYNTATKEVTTATLATVATSGSYNDLTDKPTVNYTQTIGNPVTVSSSDTLPYTVISATITTTGNPVRIHVCGDLYQASGGYPRIQIFRETSGLGRRMTVRNAGVAGTAFAIEVIDSVAAGTYTYSLKVVSDVGNGIYFGQQDGNMLNIVELK